MDIQNYKEQLLGFETEILALGLQDFTRAGALVRGFLAPARWALFLLFLLACVTCRPAYGDIGVVLNESLDTSIARITGSGHSAVYLSRICPESPIKLRLCLPNEEGSVISNYTTLGEDQPFEWNIVPLSVYLYGVEDSRDRPLFGSPEIKRALEERYREKFLSEYCAGLACRTSSKAEWREMVGAELSRSIYIFVVGTTVEQDLNLIAEFNALPNQNHFNGVTRNCADFTRRIVNTYFPGAARRNFINDLGMTSPKAVARSFTHYALRHPETGFHVLHFAQLPGDIKRSTESREGTEQLFRSKKLLVPMLLFAPHELLGAAASYLLLGRFNPERALEQYPSAEATEIGYQIQLAKAAPDQERARWLETVQNRDRVQIMGTSKEWKEYREEFDSMIQEAARQEVIGERDRLKHFLEQMDETGTLLVDGNGALWMELPKQGETYKVGLSASNVLDAGSDPRLAYQLLLARTGRVLKSPKHSRETMAELKDDWQLLENARGREALAAASTTLPATVAGAPAGTLRAAN